VDALRVVTAQLVEVGVLPDRAGDKVGLRAVGVLDAPCLELALKPIDQIGDINAINAQGTPPHWWSRTLPWPWDVAESAVALEVGRGLGHLLCFGTYEEPGGKAARNVGIPLVTPSVRSGDRS
jgi:hypothetical protein